MAVRYPLEKHSHSWQQPVLSVSNNGTATKGNRYIVGDTPTAAFTGFTEHDIADYNGTSWDQISPEAGWKLFDLDAGVYKMFNGTDWVVDDTTIIGGTEDNIVTIDANGKGKDSGMGTARFDAALNAIVWDIPDVA